MGNPVLQIVSGTGTAAPVALDWLRCPFAATVSVTVPGGVTAAFTLEQTLDNVMTTPAASVRWYTETGSPTTASGVVHLTTPVCAVRLNVTSLTGGNLELRAVQG